MLFINNSFAANTPVHINWINNLNIEKPWPEPKKEEEPSSEPDGEPDQPTDDEWAEWLNAE